MELNIQKGDIKVLLNGNCPVIQDGEKVIISEDIHEFPATNTQFVTIRAFERVNTDRFGKPEPIISTICLTDKTFQ